MAWLLPFLPIQFQGEKRYHGISLNFGGFNIEELLSNNFLLKDQNQRKFDGPFVGIFPQDEPWIIIVDYMIRRLDMV